MRKMDEQLKECGVTTLAMQILREIKSKFLRNLMVMKIFILTFFVEEAEDIWMLVKEQHRLDVKCFSFSQATIN